MNNIQKISAEPGSAIRRFFGLTKAERDAFDAEDAINSSEEDTGQAQLAGDARAGLLERIGSFLLSNDLAITPENLTLAHKAFSGGDAQLARKIRSREKSNGGVCQSWLDEQTAATETPDSSGEYHRMMDMLESNLEAYAQTTKEAYCSSATYGARLARHASDLGNLDVSDMTGPDRIVADLAQMTKSMLERTRTIEAQMRRSETEAATLRCSLATARQEAELDHLTNLPNRRSFEGTLGKHCADAKETSLPLSVAFCDIDHFKQVNDIHGHGAGDRVLKAVADSLARISGKTCHVARHGGEEFVMLFVGQGAAKAREKLDTVRERLAARKFVNRETDQPIGTITFSAGVSDVSGFEDPRDALAAADAALYEAKNSGRNRILLASECDE